MSEMEHNKGKLIPIGVDTEHFTEEDYEYYTEHGYTVIDVEIYEVEWESKHENLSDFAYVTENDDGSIDFHTYHYNGCAHWTDVVEDALDI